MTGYSKPLPIFFKGFHSFLVINKRTRDRSFQSSAPVLNICTAFCWYSPGQVREKGIHAPHHLYAGRTTSADFVEGQSKEVVP